MNECARNECNLLLCYLIHLCTSLLFNTIQLYYESGVCNSVASGCESWLMLQQSILQSIQVF